ncbi:hypothetical protein SUGI_0048820 [Cryptomeria japonica]|nr:hypothetical protein SUGI_0048820 [Cryptomeria japonica]
MSTEVNTVSTYNTKSRLGVFENIALKNWRKYKHGVADFDWPEWRIVATVNQNGNDKDCLIYMNISLRLISYHHFVKSWIFLLLIVRYLSHFSRIKSKKLCWLAQKRFLFQLKSAQALASIAF